MNYTKKEREYYNLDRQRSCERLGITVNQYNWFRRMGERLRRVYEDDCNGLIESQEASEDLATRGEEVVAFKAKELGLFIYFQTDPRGATIYLDKQPIPDNNYTQAVCIY